MCATLCATTSGPWQHKMSSTQRVSCTHFVQLRELSELHKMCATMCATCTHLHKMCATCTHFPPHIVAHIWCNSESCTKCVQLCVYNWMCATTSGPFISRLNKENLEIKQKKFRISKHHLCWRSALCNLACSKTPLVLFLVLFLEKKERKKKKTLHHTLHQSVFLGATKITQDKFGFA